MNSQSQLEEALANCDREPIHTPGSIQSFAALIATDPKLGRIEFASETTGPLLGVPASDLLGAPISDLLDSPLAHEARNALSRRAIETQRTVLGEKEFRGKLYQVSIHRKDNRPIMEFLPVRDDALSNLDALEKTRALLAESVGQEDFKDLLESSVERLRAQTGYARVKAYRFLPDGSGEVVAESRSSAVDSFLGLRFPASDIPPVARTLYASTPIRIIWDVNAEDITVLGSDPTARPLDLSLAVLRGTSGVHLQYMQNMGVRSTMTLPIVVDDKLWGLFAMHHMEPRIPDPAMLSAAELSGKILSLAIQHTCQIRHQRHLGTCATIANDLFIAEDSELSIQAFWEQNRSQLVEAIPCDGIAFMSEKSVHTFGNAPDASTCFAIRELVTEQAGDACSFDDLPRRLPDHDVGKTAGALVIPLSYADNSHLILFRDVALRTVEWAGAPTKDIVETEKGFELSPRNSFAQYSATAKDRAEEWSNDDLELAIALSEALSRAFESQKLRDNRQRLRLLVRELNHRVRNILTLVQSLSGKSRASAKSLDDYATALEQRIIALAGAHDILTREDLRGVRFDRLAELELKPHLNALDGGAVLSGPKVLLNADIAPIAALVLHELASNAVKYGALSTAEGTVSLSWNVTDTGLEIIWQEQGGPTVSTPTTEGFGRSIIESAIPYEFGGKAELEFEPSGVKAYFWLPKSEFEISDVPVVKDYEEPAQPTAPETARDTSHHALIVEDNFIIAKEMERWLRELGFGKVSAVSRVSHALSHLDSEKFDFCLLDVNLRGEISEPVAKKLTTLGTPFVFSSGYGSAGRELCDNFDAPFLTKPIDLSELRRELRKFGIFK